MQYYYMLQEMVVRSICWSTCQHNPVMEWHRLLQVTAKTATTIHSLLSPLRISSAAIQPKL